MGIILPYLLDEAIGKRVEKNLWKFIILYFIQDLECISINRGQFNYIIKWHYLELLEIITIRACNLYSSSRSTANNRIEPIL